VWKVGWWTARVVRVGVTGENRVQGLEGFGKAGRMGDEIFFDSLGGNKREERGGRVASRSSSFSLIVFASLLAGSCSDQGMSGFWVSVRRGYRQLAFFACSPSFPFARRSAVVEICYQRLERKEDWQVQKDDSS
jgi:hypothetical protein